MDGVSSVLKTIFPCLPIRTVEGSIQLPVNTARYNLISEKTSAQPSPRGDKKVTISSEEAASRIVSAMMDADKAGPSLDATIKSIVHQAGGWTEYLAAKILAAVEAVIKVRIPENAAMRDAYYKACEAFKVFPADHPMEMAIICTVVALGVLVVLAPYVVEYLGFCAGFAELGPVEGKSPLLVIQFDDEGPGTDTAPHHRFMGSHMAGYV